MTDNRPSRRRRWIIVPALLLGAGAWVVVSRRSQAAAPDVWMPRPPAERPTAAGNGTTPAAPASPRPSPTPRPRPAAAPVPSTPEGGRAPATPAIRPLFSAPSESAPPHGPGSAEPQPDGSAPGPGYTIKGNAGSMLFHPPSSPYYARTKAEVWFRTAEDAIAAGFTAYAPRRKPTP